MNQSQHKQSHYTEMTRITILTIVAALWAGPLQSSPYGRTALCDGDGSIVDREQYAGWNPEPMCDDVILPMPCDMFMPMRRVETPTSDNWLDDIDVRLGDTNPDVPYSDFVRNTALVGPLVEAGNPASRFFLIGKYEVTKRQFDALMIADAGQSCELLDSSSKIKPIDDVSWFDAVEFTRRYSNWLIREGNMESLETVSESPPFVRLPSEAEWEFSARGGIAVDTENRRGLLFPMEDEITEYVWYNSSDSCNGKVRSIGKLFPNPLGLHDMLGNVQEIVFEPYRLNSHGGLHGQFGGFVTKGGSCQTPEEQLATGMRREQPFFSGGNLRGEFKPLDTGFRIVLSAPVQTSSDRIARLSEDWKRQQETKTDTDPAQDLLAISEATVAIEERNELARIAAEVTAELAERKRIEDRSIRSSLRSGASHIRVLRRDNFDVVNRFIPFCDATPDNPQCKDGLVERAQSRKRMTQGIYMEILIQMADDYSIEEIQSQQNVVAQGFMRTAPHMERFVDIFVEHIILYKTGTSDEVSQYLDEVLAMPAFSEDR